MYIRYTMCVHTLGIAQHGHPTSKRCQRADFTNQATYIYFLYTLTCYVLVTKKKTWNIELYIYPHKTDSIDVS